MSPAPSTRLPSGRHSLTRDAVLANQRGRLLEATAEAVAEKGYAETTIADVVRRAGVSRKTFYEQFADKEEAFLAAFDAGVEIALARLAEEAAELEDRGWRERIRSDLATYMQLHAEEPAWAWSLCVEMVGAGPRALERRAQVFELFSERTKRAHAAARAEDPSLPELPDEVFLMHTGGIDELVRECLRTRGAAAVPSLTEPVVAGTFALFGART